MKRIWIVVPLLVFVTLLVVVGSRLNQPESPLPSPLIGKPLPAFSLPRLDGQGVLSAEQIKGQPTILNVFASWCAACVDEHPVWFDIARSVPVYGIAWMDDPEKTQAWLRQRGNPYRAVGVDRDSRLGLDLGVTGAPETYVIAADGRVVLKYAGVVTPQVWRDVLRPALGVTP